MKKFAVFDIDGTFFRWQLFHEIVLELIDNGEIPVTHRKAIQQKLQSWKERTHQYSWHDYEKVVVDVFVDNLKGLAVASVERAADKVLERSGKQIYTYTRDLIKQLKSQGYLLIALSGSQDEVVQRFAKHWNFDIALGQVHENKDGVYTGEVRHFMFREKGDILKQIVADHQLSWHQSIAVGDSKSDIGMLELVEQPIVFNPTDDLFAVAKEKGWKVVIERKNMIYELEPRDGTYLLAHAGTR